MRLPAAISIVALLALGACASPAAKDQASTEPLTPTERFAIDVKPQTDQLRLATHASGLSDNQAAALGYLARQWFDSQGGAIVLSTPDHGGDPAYRTAIGARESLVNQGVPAEKVRIVGYDAQGDDHAPVLVSFTRYVAKGPDCGHNWENLSATKDNRAYGNFGCAVTANLAAEIASPQDLAQPRASDPPDAGRREVVLGHYRKGDTTSTAKDTQSNGAISSAVQ
ncbi:MAG: CpaD family pilus assembly protein [Caulobacterales bacterium]